MRRKEILIELVLLVAVVVTRMGVHKYLEAQRMNLIEREETLAWAELPKHTTYYKNRPVKYYLQELVAITNYFCITEEDIKMGEEMPTRPIVMKLRWELLNSTSLSDLSPEDQVRIHQILWRWEEADWKHIMDDHNELQEMQTKYDKDELGRGYDGKWGRAIGVQLYLINAIKWEPMHNPNY